MRNDTGARKYLARASSSTHNQVLNPEVTLFCEYLPFIQGALTWKERGSWKWGEWVSECFYFCVYQRSLWIERLVWVRFKSIRCQRFSVPRCDVKRRELALESEALLGMASGFKHYNKSFSRYRCEEEEANHRQRLTLSPLQLEIKCLCTVVSFWDSESTLTTAEVSQLWVPEDYL